MNTNKTEQNKSLKGRFYTIFYQLHYVIILEKGRKKFRKKAHLMKKILVLPFLPFNNLAKLFISIFKIFAPSESLFKNIMSQAFFALQNKFQ